MPRRPAPGPRPPVLTPTAERVIRRCSVGSALLIAVAATVLSYAGLYALALRAGVTPGLALLVPVMVDGMQFVGSLGVVYSTLCGLRTAYPWLLMLLGVAVSVWGNWIAAPPGLAAKAVHSASPLVLAVVLEELLRVTRYRVALAHQGRTVAVGSPAATPRPRPAPVPAPVPAPPPPPRHPGLAIPAPPGPPSATGQGAPRAPGEGGTARERIRALLTAHPDLPAAEAARRLGIDPSHTRRIVREIRSRPAAPTAALREVG